MTTDPPTSPSGAPFIPAPVKPIVTLDALDAIDVRVGTIASVRDLPGTERLVVLTVDLGAEQRSVVAGLKQERVDPSALAGLQALFVVNVPPRAIRGETSEAMLFDIGFADGLRPVLAVPESPMPPGARAG